MSWIKRKETNNYMEYIVLIITFAFALCSRLTKNKNKVLSIILYILSFITLFLFSGFREYLLPQNKIGTDYNQYINWFHTNIKATYVNIGFNSIIFIIKLFTTNYLPMFIVSSFLILAGIYVYAYKNTEYYELAILFFMASMLLISFNAVRQFIACSIFLISYQYLKEKNFKKYALLIFFAFLFHSSALILLLLYPVVHLNINMKLKLTIVAFIGAIISAIPGLLNILLNLVRNIDAGYYYRYKDLIMVQSGANFILFAITMIVLLIMIYFYEKYKDKNLNANMELNMMLILVIITFLAPQNLIYNRLSLYMLPCLMITIPNLLSLIDNKKHKNIAYGVVTAMCLVMFM